MPTTTPLTDAIQALTTYANETTGASDTTLSAAVGTLVAGYGGGGGWSSTGIATKAEPYGEITLDNSVTRIADNALNGRPITRIYAADVTTAMNGACSGSGLTRIEETDMPKLTSMTGGFESCTSLTYIKLTGVIASYSYAFRGCSNLVEAYFPNATANIDRTCNGCGKLQIMDCGSSNITNANSFQNCTALRTLIMRKTSGVQTIAAWSANCMGGIYNNPAQSTIYVPSALISSYQTASNWSSAYAAGVTFTAIEGSQYE